MGSPTEVRGGYDEERQFSFGGGTEDCSITSKPKNLKDTPFNVSYKKKIF